MRYFPPTRRTLFFLLFLLQMNRLGALKGVTLVELLPAADAASLDADHLLPAVLGCKVGHAGRLGGVRVPDDDVVEVVADDAEARGAVLAQDDGLLGPAGGGVYAVELAVKGDAAGLRLGGHFGELVDVGRLVEAVDGYFGNVLW